MGYGARRRLRQGANVRQRLQPVLIRHKVIEGDHIDAAFGDPIEAADAIGRDLDDIPVALQILLDKPAQAGIVIDVKDARAGFGH